MLLLGSHIYTDNICFWSIHLKQLVCSYTQRVCGLGWWLSCAKVIPLILFLGDLDIILRSVTMASERWNWKLSFNFADTFLCNLGKILYGSGIYIYIYVDCHTSNAIDIYVHVYFLLLYVVSMLLHIILSWSYRSWFLWLAHKLEKDDNYIYNVFPAISNSKTVSWAFSSTLWK